jgi:hypothetical protein
MNSHREKYVVKYSHSSQKVNNISSVIEEELDSYITENQQLN